MQLVRSSQGAVSFTSIGNVDPFIVIEKVKQAIEGQVVGVGTHHVIDIRRKAWRYAVARESRTRLGAPRQSLFRYDPILESSFATAH